jgi:cytochrome c553
MSNLKWFKYGSALSAVLLIVPFASAEPRSTAPAIVTRYCSGCHGMDGKSQLPYIPRLAGLSATYSERKLASFRAAASAPVDEAFNRIAHIGSASKDAGITASATAHMVGTSHAISDEDLKAAAEWYAAQVPAHGRGGNGKLIEEGRNLFINGLESQGLPACQTCHGPEAQGTDKAPRLAGQNAAYVVGQLAHFRTGDSHNSPEMTGVARYVERDQARAVAAYLQSR